MYRAYWGLRSTPFQGGASAEDFFLSATHEEALARLHFLTDQRRRLGLVFGADGSGKSLLLATFAQKCREAQHDVARMNLTGLSMDEFPRQLAYELGLNLAESVSSFSLWRHITDRITESGFQNRSTVVLLDDADQTSPEVLDQVLRLVHVEGPHPLPLTVILTARPEHDRVSFLPLTQRADLRIELNGWELQDTAHYVTTTLDRAGSKTSPFQDQAVERLHALAEGIPRRVNQLADLALLAGAGHELSSIDVATVDAVYHELSFAVN